MKQRVLKIILPGDNREKALALLGEDEKLIYWQEEKTGSDFVASVLIDSTKSEAIMDKFEGTFSSLDGFKLVLFPVEASIPRLDSEEDKEKTFLPRSIKKQKKNTNRISREELYADVVESTNLSTSFIMMTILSTIVVAIGLQNNNVAVIIGSMVIAPFLGPNVALALSTTLSDFKLGFNAFKTLVTGIVLVLLLSVVMGYIFDTNPHVPEIALRTKAGFSDIVLALASGIVGVLAFTTGMSSALIGVMVAVALLPPLTVCGLLLGIGSFSAATSAFLLFISNIICINLAGVVTFFIQGVSPRTWWESDRAKKATHWALLIWSILLIILVAVIYIWQ